MVSYEWLEDEAGCPSAAGKTDGVLEDIVDWAGSTPRKWFLIAGAMDPPTSSGATRRVRANGEKGCEFLEGIDLDFRRMTKAVGSDLHNKVLDMKLTLKEAKSKIREFFQACQKLKCVPMLYYTGHGAVGSGDWCFQDGCLAFSDIVKLLPSRTKFPWIFADCCFAGHWANQARLLFRPPLVRVVAATPYFMTALDTDDGGDFTYYITGNKPARRLERPVICSRRSMKDFPLPASVACYPYADRVEGEIGFGDRFVMAQHFHEEECSLFCAAIPCYDVGKYPAKTCTMFSYSALRTWIEEDCWAHGLNVMHISCSSDRRGAGFGAYAVHGFGSRQQIFAGTFQHIQGCIQKNGWMDGWSTTCICPGIGQDWVAVVTQCRGDYLYGDSQESTQFLYKASSWKKVKALIKEEYDEGNIVTQIAVSYGTWVLATHESPRKQTWIRGDKGTGLRDVSHQLCDRGFDVTLLLKDPSDRWLVFGTRGLNAYNRSYCTGIAQVSDEASDDDSGISFSDEYSEYSDEDSD